MQIRPESIVVNKTCFVLFSFMSDVSEENFIYFCFCAIYLPVFQSNPSNNSDFQMQNINNR